MIMSRQDYFFYLQADRIGLKIENTKGFREKVYGFIIGNDVWKFQRLLRKVEYYQNCRASAIWKPYYSYLYFKFYRMQVRLGFYVHPNCFGPGLSISHPGTLLVSPKARIGANCRIHPCVVIGDKLGFSPKIGNNVYIGPGAKIFGNITIADGVAIGANSVINKSILEPNITVAGIPARKVSDKGSKGLVIDATDFLKTKQSGLDEI